MGGGSSVPTLATRGGAQAPLGAGSTLSPIVSALVAISSTTTTFVTTWALAIAAASIVALLLVDRVKPSRPKRVAARARRRGQPLDTIVVVEEPTMLYRRTPIWKRLFAFTGLGVMGVILGALLAMVVAVLVVAALTLLAGLS